MDPWTTLGETSDRSLWIVEARRIGDKRGDGEDAGDETQRRADRHPGRHERLVAGAEQHVDAAADRAARRRVVARRRRHESVGTAARGRRRRGGDGRRRRPGDALSDPAAAERVEQLGPAGVVRQVGDRAGRVLDGVVLVVAGGGGVVGWRVDAQVAAVTTLRQLRAVEYSWPPEVEPTTKYSYTRIRNETRTRLTALGPGLPG